MSEARRPALTDQELRRRTEKSLPVPEEIDPRQLDPAVRGELRSLSKDTADRVARHLIAAGLRLDDDPAGALAHAYAARAHAARIPAVREAVGLAAYRVGEWAVALSELRAVRRMSGRGDHLPIIADSERALGRPERALELFGSPEATALAPAERVELLMVAAGARLDLGQADAAVVMLQVPELRPTRPEPWTARIRYAYADLLLAAGRRDEAYEWFGRAAEVDADGGTDAVDRLLELDGVVLDEDAEDDAEEPGPGVDDAAGGAGIDVRPTEDGVAHTEDGVAHTEIDEPGADGEGERS